MCGICGEWRLDGDASSVSVDVLQRMCKSITHRGPDGQGIYVAGRGGRTVVQGEDGRTEGDGGHGRIGLGARRLSIIDLDTGAQPVHNEDSSLWIVFNGEVYNYRELRLRLEARGHRFSTRSDTETIVHLYEDDRDTCVRSLNGMFAFAVWDEPRERLLLARDRLGIKPVFYAWDGGRLVFASEIKGILEAWPRPEVDVVALHDYLSLGYIPAPRTIYQGIQKLPPAHLLIADRAGVRVEQYWDLPARPPTRRRAPSIEEAGAELLDRLRRAVSGQMVSDVPLGVFLSGGLDSSTLVALMSEVSERPVRTFSIGFEEASYSELPAARLIASRFGTDHTELIVRPEVRDLLPGLIRTFDEPFADSSAIPTYYLSQLARSRVTVALGGDGGDEVFAGYETYVATQLARYYSRLPRALRHGAIGPLVRWLPASEAKVSFDYKAKRFVSGADLPPGRAHFSWKVLFTEDAKTQLYREGYPRPDRDSYEAFGCWFDRFRERELLDRLQYADLKVYLPDDILTKVDRTSMANSLEVRVPLLDHEIVEFVLTLPPSLRLHGLSKKHVLKHAIASLLPKPILRRRKRGFNVPIARWLRRDLRGLVAEYLSPSMVRRQGCFDPAIVSELVRRHDDGRVDYGRNLWSLLVFSMWSEQWRA